MTFPTLIQHLMGYIVKVTEYKYSVSVLACYVMECGVIHFTGQNLHCGNPNVYTI